MNYKIQIKETPFSKTYKGAEDVEVEVRTQKTAKVTFYNDDWSVATNIDYFGYVNEIPNHQVDVIYDYSNDKTTVSWEG